MNARHDRCWYCSRRVVCLEGSNQAGTVYACPTCVSLHTGQTFVRINSHRSRDKLESLCGRAAMTFYYSFHHPGEWARIPAHHLPRAITIKDISRARIPLGGIRQCL